MSMSGLRALALTVVAASVLSACEKPAPPPPRPASKSTAEDCLRHRDYECAASNYGGYLVQYPEDMDVRAIYAITLTRMGKHREAIPHYAYADKGGIVTYDFYAGYAESLDAVGRLDDAIAYNRKSLDLVPNLVDVRGDLARQLVKKGQREEAIKLLEDFDAYLKKQGQPAYFTGQIAAIKAAK